MVAIGEHELRLLKRIRTELGGTLAPHGTEEISMAVRLSQAGYLDDDSDDEDAFVLSDLGEEYLDLLLG